MTTLLKLIMFRIAALVTLLVPTILAFQLFPGLTTGLLYLPLFTIALAAGLMTLDEQVRKHLIALDKKKALLKTHSNYRNRRLTQLRGLKHLSHSGCRLLGLNCNG